MMAAVTQEEIEVFESELLTRYVDRVGAKRAKLVKTHTIGENNNEYSEMSFN
jgi:hypothetical protein